MTVLIADKFEAWGVEELKQAGFDVAYEPALDGESLGEALHNSGASVLVVRSTKVPAEALKRADSLALIVRAGAGYDNIDVAAASGRGIMVANCPGKNAVAVAELTFALILGLDRRVAENVCELRAGTWNKKEYAKARGLKGRCLGLLGFGSIGQAVGRRALGFEMRVIAWSRSLTRERAAEFGVERGESPAAVAAACDILSVHVASAPETRRLVDGPLLARMKPGSYLINTSRADVVDSGALAAAIKEKQLRVGLDVFSKEPSGGQGEFADPIVKADGLVYGTHHIGASTDQAQDAIAAETVRIVKAYVATGQAPNCVNIETRSPARCQLVVRHYDKVGVLASVLDKLRRAEINVEEMSNTVFQGAQAAVAVIRLGETPSAEVLASIAGMREMVIQAEVKPL